MDAVALPLYVFKIPVCTPRCTGHQEAPCVHQLAIYLGAVVGLLLWDLFTAQLHLPLPSGGAPMTSLIIEGGNPAKSPAEAKELAKEYIARITLLAKWNQKRLADEMGISAQTITNWVAGRRTPETFRMIQLKHMVTRIENAIKRRAAEERRVAREVANDVM